MDIRALSQMFRGKNTTYSADLGIPLVDFRPHTARTIAITPVTLNGDREPTERSPVPASDLARHAALGQLRTVVERLDGRTAEAGNGAAREGHSTLAADFNGLACAAAGRRCIDEALAGIRAELADVKCRLAALEQNAVDLRTPRLAWRQRVVAKAEALRDLHSQATAKAARSRVVDFTRVPERRPAG